MLKNYEIRRYQMPQEEIKALVKQKQRMKKLSRKKDTAWRVAGRDRRQVK